MALSDPSGRVIQPPKGWRPTRWGRITYANWSHGPEGLYQVDIQCKQSWNHHYGSPSRAAFECPTPNTYCGAGGVRTLVCSGGWGVSLNIAWPTPQPRALSWHASLCGSATSTHYRRKPFPNLCGNWGKESRAAEFDGVKLTFSVMNSNSLKINVF